MLRSYLLMNITDFDDYLPEMERWLFRDHAPDTMSQMGPILDRYTTYRAMPEPQGAAQFCCYNWRMMEHWWRENPFKNGTRKLSTALSEIWCDNYNKASGIPEGEPARVRHWRKKAPAFVFFGSRPTEDFKGNKLRLLDGNIMRWITVFKYPEGVTAKEGDDWYLNIHAGEVAEQPQLKRFFSFSAVEPSSQLSPFMRVSELWYENGTAWRKAIIGSGKDYTRPAWATYKKYPFLEPGVDFISIFLLERPECDFLRDYSGYITTA